MWVSVKDMDLDTGRRIFDKEEEDKIDADRAAKPMWKKMINAVF